MMSFFEPYLASMAKLIQKVDGSTLAKTAQRIMQTSLSGRKIILIGNGGSAAMASHVSVDFTKIARIRAVNFNEADLITCLANDFGYEHLFEKALEFYADSGDLVVLISSSGESENMIHAARKARDMNLGVVTFSGFQSENRLRQMGDINFWIDSQQCNWVEMTHHVWLLSIVDHVIASIPLPTTS